MLKVLCGNEFVELLLLLDERMERFSRVPKMQRMMTAIDQTMLKVLCGNEFVELLLLLDAVWLNRRVDRFMMLAWLAEKMFFTRQA